MRMTLWQRGGEDGELVRESLRGLCTLAGITFDAVDTLDALLVATAHTRRSNDTHIIVVDCYHGEIDDMDRCAAVIDQTNRTKPPIHVIHPDEQVVRDLEGIAGRPLGWLPSDFTVAVLREKLHALRAAVAIDVSVENRPLLTAREREVAELIADGQGNRKIEEALHLTKNTVKTYMRTLLQKFGVTTRAEFIAAYRDRREGVTSLAPQGEKRARKISPGGD